MSPCKMPFSQLSFLPQSQNRALLLESFGDYRYLQFFLLLKAPRYKKTQDRRVQSSSGALTLSRMLLFVPVPAAVLLSCSLNCGCYLRLSEERQLESACLFPSLWVSSVGTWRVLVKWNA